jgi:hypothetical protein
MSPDEPSLSEHEQRILAEIERNLQAEDPEFVRQVSEAKHPANKSSARLFQLSLFGLLIGMALLGGYFTNLGVGVLGFLVMLASVVGIVTSLRNLAAVGRSPSSALRDAFRRAEERMRTRRPPEG